MLTWPYSMYNITFMRSCKPCHVSIRFMVSGWKGHLSIYCLVCRSQLSLRQNTTMTVAVSSWMLNTDIQKMESWEQRQGNMYKQWKYHRKMDAVHYIIRRNTQDIMYLQNLSTKILDWSQKKVDWRYDERIMVDDKLIRPSTPEGETILKTNTQWGLLFNFSSR